ncbi:lysozyme [Kingella negevensis]|uniref:lysozyme n=1 Tax=Kingella negevensis TaxID=1522312 RepID=UPI0025439B1F|nr:lysozyme [Kingella negevensis]MDK4680366.1 lysozyme [Kingella negevensis]MDK4681912.1 lysozyme [Kingella negevensis]MDK4690109.1 lysozyme [Kingella negevensis]MDK4692545.1 lysozyme [Kingella negevensis]MDK4698844.1 lysozyme [Kingella negevensis]
MFEQITTHEPATLLRAALVDFEKGVTSSVKVEISQNQFDALVCFVYNVGLDSLRKSTLLRRVNAKDFVGAALEFSKWNTSGGRALAGLTKRCAAERTLFLTGG